MRAFLTTVFLIFCISKASYANGWVEVSEMTTSSTTGNKIFHVNHSWPYQDTDEEVSICKSGCLISVFFEGGKIYNTNSSDLMIISSADNCYTMQCLWNRWTLKNGTGMSTSVWDTSQSEGIQGCWSFLAFPLTSGSSVTGEGVRLPGAICMYPPPENVKCEINNLYDFNHGELTSADVNSSVVSQAATLSCNATVSVNAYLGYDDRVRLSGGSSNITSLISINNQTLTRTTPALIKANSGNNDIEVKSELKSDGYVAAGQYEGSNVIILELN